MGKKIIQRIYDCDVCGTTPDDGEPMWYMGTQIWCEKCTKDDDNY